MKVWDETDLERRVIEDVEDEMWKKNGVIIKERRENESTQGQEAQNKIRKVKIETQYKTWTWSPNQYYTKMTWMIVAILVADFLILGGIAHEACYSPFNSVRFNVKLSVFKKYIYVNLIDYVIVHIFITFEYDMKCLNTQIILYF